eukprot:SAG22_NODE_205_length_15308_cov_20.539023_5_plen_202_part_00
MPSSSPLFVILCLADMVREELDLASVRVPINATYPAPRPDPNRFPGGLLVEPERVTLGPTEREVGSKALSFLVLPLELCLSKAAPLLAVCPQIFGVLYNDGKPMGEQDVCMMEPRELVAFSKQLFEEGMGSLGEDVVYGAVMFPVRSRLAIRIRIRRLADIVNPLYSLFVGRVPLPERGPFIWFGCLSVPNNTARAGQLLQ